MLEWIQWKNIFSNTQSMVLKGETVSPDIAITQTFGMPRYLWSFWTPLCYLGQRQNKLAACFRGTTLPKTTSPLSAFKLIKPKSVGPRVTAAMFSPLRKHHSNLRQFPVFELEFGRHSGQSKWPLESLELHQKDLLVHSNLAVNLRHNLSMLPVIQFLWKKGVLFLKSRNFRCFNPESSLSFRQKGVKQLPSPKFLLFLPIKDPRNLTKTKEQLAYPSSSWLHWFALLYLPPNSSWYASRAKWRLRPGWWS